MRVRDGWGGRKMSRDDLHPSAVMEIIIFDVYVDKNARTST